MSDVFVSYARPDEPVAKRVVEALVAAGYRAWRDDELPAHRAYADVIQERLNAAKAVVVLWSANSAKSQWVRAEAEWLGRLSICNWRTRLISNAHARPVDLFAAREVAVAVERPVP